MRLVAALLLALAAWGSPSRARAQACCAGGTAITPGRLGLHDNALVGADVKAGTVLGTYYPGGHFYGSPPGFAEGDFEEDVFGAARVLPRGQVAVLVPFIETQRTEPNSGSGFGGGLGDVNLSARYDFVLAGESLYVPGIALLAGVTFPTGVGPGSGTPPLLVNVTGTGAYQANGALAFEQTFGPWLFNLTGLLAWRSAQAGEQLAPQLSLLAATAYTLPNDVAIALSFLYATEGDARALDGTAIPLSAKGGSVVTLGALWPFADTWRVLGGVYLDPPVDGLGNNQPAATGLTLTLIRSWS